MSNTMENDVLSHILHEHRHLTHLFDDVYETFAKLAEGSLDHQEREDALANAAEDLSVALEEMITHFNEEEEVFFVEIESRFPDLAPEIAQLITNHETMAEHTRWLLTFLARSERDLLGFQQALEVVTAMRGEIRIHTEAESRVYGDALRRMDDLERAQMLNQLRSL